MAKTAARIAGVALTPGTSKNNRSYSQQAIAKMVARAQQRISSGDAVPIIMKTSHETADATKVVGKLTSMRVDENGAAAFTADVAGTKAGRDVAKLLKGGYLGGVSIAGRWVGPTRTERGPDGQPVECGSDLELTSLDYVTNPGVPGARITAVESAPPGQIREDAPVVTVHGKRARLVEQAVNAFDTEGAILRAISEAELSGRLAASLAGRRPVTESGSKAAAASTAGVSDSDLANLSQDEFEAAADAYWAGKLGAIDAAKPRSPFWAGLDNPAPQ